MKVPNALNRDDTVHGTYYYIASEADKIIDELRAENAELTAEAEADAIIIQYHEATIQRQRRVLEQALEALKSLFGTPDINTGAGGGGVAVWRLGGSCAPTQAITAIQGVLK